MIKTRRAMPARRLQLESETQRILSDCAARLDHR